MRALVFAGAFLLACGSEPSTGESSPTTDASTKDASDASTTDANADASNDADADGSQGCGEGLIKPCGSEVGACEPGTQLCAGGVWGPCEGSVEPTSEKANGIDDDCDGSIDEGFSCTNGATMPCGSDIPPCEFGTQVCESGSWGTCQGGIGPVPEACNAIDDDCNGTVDDGSSACGGVCPLGDALGTPCDGADDDLCLDDAIVCEGQNAVGCSLGDNDAELCNGLDDDCDGTVDEGSNPCGGACSLTELPGASCDSSADDDACLDDTRACLGLNDTECVDQGVDSDGDGYSVGASGCNGDCDDADPIVNPGANELCNSNDDDCNGVVDDGSNACGGSCQLTSAPGASCDYPGGTDIDTCNDDELVCVGLNALACGNAGSDADGDGFSKGSVACAGDCNDNNAQAHAGGIEVCNDGIDQNCSAGIDDGCPPTQSWVRHFGAGVADEGYAVSATNDGGAFVTGFGDAGCVFGPGEPGQATLPANSGAFLARYSAGGQLIWVTSPIGASEGHGVATASDGGAFVAGTLLAPQVSFGSTTLSTVGGTDGFVARYDSSGSPIWAKRFGSPNDEYIGGVAASPDGGAVVVGTFVGSATFGQGEVNQTVLSAQPPGDGFIAKYDAAGALVWAKSTTGVGAQDVRGVEVFPDNSLTISGAFQDGTAILGLGEPGEVQLTPVGGADGFVARLSSSGQLVWARGIGAGGFDAARSVTAVPDGTTVVAGDFSGTAILGAGEPNQTQLVGPNDMFVAKYQSNGDLIWARSAGGTLWEYGFGVSTSADGSVFVGGGFYGNAQFGSTTLVSVDSWDLYVTKLNASGAFVWARRSGGPGNNWANDLTVLPDGRAIAIGHFEKTTTFFPGEPGQTILTLPGLVRHTYVAWHSP